MPPRGWYTAYAVGLLAGVSGRTIGQWARRGYIRSSQSAGNPRIYSYQDAAEALVVHELLVAHFSHKEIKSAISLLRQIYPLNWPLQNSPDLAVAGEADGVRGRLVRGDEAAAFDLIDRPEQEVINPENLRRISEYLRRGGWAARTRPEITHVEVDPDRLSGEPVIKGTRISAAHIAELARVEGNKVARLDYDVTDVEIEDAKKWWAAVRGYARTA